MFVIVIDVLYKYIFVVNIDYRCGYTLNVIQNKPNSVKTLEMDVNNHQYTYTIYILKV